MHKHNCECGHFDCCNNDYEEKFMTIITQENEELKCSVIDIFDVEDNSYIALLPVGQDEVLLYRYVQKEQEEFELLNIESDEEFKKVEDVFFDIFNEELFEDVDFEE